MNDPQTVGLDSTVMQNEELVAADLAGETAVLSIKTGKYYGMDAMGSRIWDIIAQPRTVAEVCALLLEEYDVTPERCQQDALTFLSKLYQEHLVKLC